MDDIWSIGGLFEIVREPRYEQEIQALTVTYKRLHELELAIDRFVLKCVSNKQYICHIQGNNYLWKMEKIDNQFPQLLIVFEIDELNQKIILKDLKEADSLIPRSVTDHQ